MPYWIARGADGRAYKKNTTARVKQKQAIARYIHCTLWRACSLSPISTKMTKDPMVGATTVPMPLNACEMLIRNSEYFGGPQTVIYGFAAVSREPSPFPIMKMAAQKPPKDLCRMQGHAINAPMAYRQRPHMKTGLYPQCLNIQLACPRDASGYAPK